MGVLGFNPSETHGSPFNQTSKHSSLHIRAYPFEYVRLPAKGKSERAACELDFTPSSCQVPALLTWAARDREAWGKRGGLVSFACLSLLEG